jgi:hypothetical protein
MIRNISQTCQEREIIKTAPDVVVYIDGLPYLTNYFLNDQTTGKAYTLVNFNDHVASFSAGYDTDMLVPNCSIGLQVPNFQKYLYQTPGGNNLLQTMAQVQVYAKAYYMSSQGDTIYRRVFKGVTSHISYNDNGKTLQIDVQCHGAMYMLEKMMINIHPAVNTAVNTGSNLTIWQSILANCDCFETLAAIFTEGFQSDGFQFSSLEQDALVKGNPFFDAVQRGYMAKWQAILFQMVKDVHIYGPNKDNLGQSTLMQRSKAYKEAGKDTKAASVQRHTAQKESVKENANQTYYQNIQKYAPFKTITQQNLTDNVIVNRLDMIRQVVNMIDFEGYQDIDGKIIIKPPLYNLDVTDLGSRSQQTTSDPVVTDQQAQANQQSTLRNLGPDAIQSSPSSGTRSNSLTNPLTQIYENNNPFVIYLSEILTEQETEDQSAIRRTRTTLTGNKDRDLNINYPANISPTVEWTDVAKMAKFGLREEPAYMVPWLPFDKISLFAHACAETARANRGYRTYTVTIPLRPEIKLGFPVFIPHKDMYAYVKSVNIQYQVGGTATMTVTCDSVRRRVLVNTWQTVSTGGTTQKSYAAYTSAPNLVLQWTDNPKQPTSIDPGQSPGNSVGVFTANANNIAGGPQQVSQSGSSPSSIVGSSTTLPVPDTNTDGTKLAPSNDQVKIHSYKSNVVKQTYENAFSSPTAVYVVKNDGSQAQGTIAPGTNQGYFNAGQFIPADYKYMEKLVGSKSGSLTTHSTIPYTDDKGYELVAPFPWGRWQNLNAAIHEFTEAGWVGTNAPLTLNDVVVLQSTDALLFAGLGTPSASGDASNQLLTAMSSLQSTVGGLSSTAIPPSTSNPKGGQQQNPAFQPDATVIVLKYDQPGVYSDQSLLNTAQPEDTIAAALIAGAQNADQQLVDVLVSGYAAPIPAVQETLIASQNKPPSYPLTPLPQSAKFGTSAQGIAPKLNTLAEIAAFKMSQPNKAQQS